MTAEAGLKYWIEHLPAGYSLEHIQLIAGDASPRRYYRVGLGKFHAPSSLIAAISPQTEKNPEFLQVRELLERAGVRVPGLRAADIDQGFLLLEDLGDQTLLPVLSIETVERWYPEALGQLARIAAIDIEAASLPPYDQSRLQTEMALFPEWFCKRLLGLELTRLSQASFAALSESLIASAFEQPQVVVHRDFHSRNLMVVPSKESGVDELATIDFQDAVIGPITYDPVSLLKDCYVRWPREQQLSWLTGYQQQLQQQGLMAPVSEDTFVQWFDLMGLQRHIKVLGIFARLWLRDGKPGYLKDLPLVLAYTREALALYRHKDWAGAPAVEAFADWFETQVMPTCEQQAWFMPVPVFNLAESEGLSSLSGQTP